MLGFVEQEIRAQAGQFLKNNKRLIEGLEKSLRLLRPETAFQRGFSLTSKNGRIITSAKQLVEGDEILTQLKNGEVRSKVKK